MDNATNAAQAASNVETLEALSGTADDAMGELCHAARELESAMGSVGDEGLTNDELQAYIDEAHEARAYMAAIKHATLQTLANVAATIAAL